MFNTSGTTESGSENNGVSNRSYSGFLLIALEVSFIRIRPFRLASSIPSPRVEPVMKWSPRFIRLYNITR